MHNRHSRQCSAFPSDHSSSPGCPPHTHTGPSPAHSPAQYPARETSHSPDHTTEHCSNPAPSLHQRTAPCNPYQCPDCLEVALVAIRSVELLALDCTGAEAENHAAQRVGQIIHRWSSQSDAHDTVVVDLAGEDSVISAGGLYLYFYFIRLIIS